MRKDRSEKWEHSRMAEDMRGHSDLIHSYSPNTVCQPLSMCRERSNVLTHFFSVCTADISLSYADSNYLRTANPPEGGRRRGEEEEEEE